jgi:nicotinamide-nucleotide amidase
MLPEVLVNKAASVIEALSRDGLTVATAESCTGGLVTAALTAIAGSSSVVERGFVTYSNQAKIEMLGVDAALLDSYGAVSEEVARAMAEGALSHSPAALAVSVTGIAGPGGGSPAKPVGLVHFACARRGGATISAVRIFSGDRDAVRLQAALTALELLMPTSR